MNDAPFLILTKNVILLLAVTFVFDVATSRFRLRQSLLWRAFAGFTLGSLGIAVMLTPWVFGSGIVFDTRSVLLGISGLFFGTLPTVIAMAMTAAFRFHQGGTGILTGVCVILSSGLIGIAWRHYRRRHLDKISWGELYLFGVVVHAVMLGWMFTLPWATALRVLSSIALPVILIYPAGTALLGVSMTNRWRREQAQEALEKSEEKFRKTFYTSPDAVNINRLTDGMYVSINPAFTRITGYTEEEAIGKTSSELNIWHRAEDRQRLVEGLKKDGQVINLEAVFRMKNGEPRDGLMSASIIDFECAPHILNITRDITELKQEKEKLRESEQKYRWVVDNMADVITVTDMDLRFTYVSPSILRLRGFTPKEAMAQTMDQVMTPESMRVITEAFEEEMELEAGGTADPGRSRILELQEYRKDGSIIWVENTMSYIRDENLKPMGFISVSRDITGRKQNEERLKGRLRQLAALREIDMAITGSLDMRVTLSVFLNQVTETLVVDAAGVLLLDPYSHRLAFAAGRGFLTDALRHTNISLGEGFAGQAARDRRMISIPDMHQEGRELFRKSPLLSNEKFVSYYCAPLIAKGHVKGVLEIFNRTPLNPDPEWMDYLEALATQAAIAIDNASLFDDLQKSNLEIVLSYDSTLEGWSRALDMRDRETEGHSRRVTEMTVKIAQKMGIRNSELVHVRRGALLHDIGKMGIPDSILLKPGALNDEEWKIMRNHPAKAYELLSPISYLRPALDIPYAHHEKWDGTGYPRGLKGEQIPLVARIFAIVDTWDALRSDRPYRSAWPEQKAIEYIRAQAGLHFDPDLVRVFLDILDEWEETDRRAEDGSPGPLFDDPDGGGGGE